MIRGGMGKAIAAVSLSSRASSVNEPGVCTTCMRSTRQAAYLEGLPISWAGYAPVTPMCWPAGGRKCGGFCSTRIRTVSRFLFHWTPEYCEVTVDSLCPGGDGHQGCGA